MWKYLILERQSVLKENYILTKKKFECKTFEIGHLLFALEPNKPNLLVSGTSDDSKSLGKYFCIDKFLHLTMVIRILDIFYQKKGLNCNIWAN